MMYMHFLGDACDDVEVGILLIQLFRGEAQSPCEGVTLSADFSSCFIEAQFVNSEAQKLRRSLNKIFVLVQKERR